MVAAMAVAMGMLLEDHVVVVPLVAPLVAALVALLAVLPLVHALLVMHSMDLMGEVVLLVPLAAMGMISIPATFLHSNTSYKIALLV